VAELSVGVVGSGWVATDRYLPVLARLDEVRIAGIADRNFERARAVAGEYDTIAYGDATELFEAHPDVVFICTSPFSHASLAIGAMEQGINVFVEKPMALDSDEANRMVATSVETGTKLGVSHNLLFSRSVSSVSRKLARGDLGRILHVLGIQSSSPRRRLPHWYPELPGGLFFDEAPHMIYLLDAFVGELEVRDGWSRKEEGSEALAGIGVDFVGTAGVHAELTMIFEAPVSEWFVSLICEGGVAVLDLFRDIHFVIPPDGDHRPARILRSSLAGMLGHGAGTISTGVRYVARRQFWGHDVIIPDFLNAVRHDRAPAVTGDDGARVLGIMAKVLEVVRAG
jgi:predicted dehydrogenase